MEKAPPKFSQRVGPAIKQLRRRRGIPGREFAEALGIAYGSLRNVEAGYRGLTLDRLKDAADLLGLPVSYVIACAEGLSDAGTILPYWLVNPYWPRPKLAPFSQPSIHPGALTAQQVLELADEDPELYFVAIRAFSYESVRIEEGQWVSALNVSRRVLQLIDLGLLLKESEKRSRDKGPFA